MASVSPVAFSPSTKILNASLAMHVECQFSSQNSATMRPAMSHPLAPHLAFESSVKAEPVESAYSQTGSNSVHLPQEPKQEPIFIPNFAQRNDLDEEDEDVDIE